MEAEQSSPAGPAGRRPSWVSRAEAHVLVFDGGFRSNEASRPVKYITGNLGAFLLHYSESPIDVCLNLFLSRFSV